MNDLNAKKLELIQKIATLSDGELQTLLEKAQELQGKDNYTIAKKGVAEFNEKELNAMPKHIKKLILIDKKRCRLRTRQSGKNGLTYQIRFIRDGYNITAHGKTIELAKANFIEKCKAAENCPQSSTTNTPTTFDSFAQFYFKNFRAEKVAAATFKNDILRYKKNLKSHFKKTQLKNITPSDCKTLLDKVKAQGKGKTAEELRSLLSVIFKSAIAHGIIDRNPLDIVLHVQHERKHGTALTQAEEQRLKLALKDSEHLQAFMILLYTGLRPNELKTAKIDGLFIVAQNSKRKNKKIQYKKIPIIDALKPYLLEPFKFAQPYTLRENLKKILPNHILYDLRTTFYTRCDEFDVSTAARDFFVGHSSGTLTDTYRNLSDDYLLKQAKRLNKWV